MRLHLLSSACSYVYNDTVDPLTNPTHQACPNPTRITPQQQQKCFTIQDHKYVVPFFYVRT